MNRSNSNSESTVLRLTLATVVAFLLAGVAILVSANTKIPVAGGSQRLLQLSGSAVSHPANRIALVHNNNSEDSVNSAPVQLSPDQLKRNALYMLRSFPDYQSTAQDYAITTTALQNDVKYQHPAINVNTFLLSKRISNQSQLAELQMQPFFGEFNSALFLQNEMTLAANDVVHSQENQDQRTTFIGVGFPHIENNARPESNRYKPYKQLVSFSSDDNGDIVPHVKCMGLSPQSVASRAEKYDAKIFELAVKHNVSASLVKAVVAKESCFNPKALSHAGAIGLMQLMPETARWLKVKKPENPQQNLAAGVRYLAQLRKRFGSNELALAAYNAGPGNVERYNGIPPFAETEQYVHDVMYFYRGYVATTRFVNAQNSF